VASPICLPTWGEHVLALGAAYNAQCMIHPKVQRRPKSAPFGVEYGARRWHPLDLSVWHASIPSPALPRLPHSRKGSSVSTR
jgi:hypothetical protein